MSRVKRGTTKLKSRRYTLAKMKGGRFGIGSKERATQEAIFHAAEHSFSHRKDKKGDFRRLWTVRLNAALRPLNFSYSVFIKKLKTKEIGLNRKVLSEIAQESPESFKRIVSSL
jgi:large subunit ribosomal protein L20